MRDTMVASALWAGQVEAQNGFDAHVQRSKNTSYKDYQSINGISQATANNYVYNGIAKAGQVSMNYGCAVPTVPNAAVNKFENNVNAAKNNSNAQISQIKAQKKVQYDEYQAYLEYLRQLELARQRTKNNDDGNDGLVILDRDLYPDNYFVTPRYSENSTTLAFLGAVYNSAYKYYSYVSYEPQRIQFANDAAMKYMIYDRFYSGKYKALAWETIAGNPDYGALNYLNQFPEYKMLKNMSFYDTNDWTEIDFIHMIGTINANTFDRLGWGPIDDSLNIYAGWAGDLITLAGDAQLAKDLSNEDVYSFVKNALSSEETRFSQADLFADIDAIAIADIVKKDNKPIHMAIEEYYSSANSTRYSDFLANQYYGSSKVLEQTAQSFLNPSITTFAFKKVFESDYSRSIIPDVSKAFADFIVERSQQE